jgi:hypothetical protein
MAHRNIGNNKVILRMFGKGINRRLEKTAVHSLTMIMKKPY